MSGASEKKEGSQVGLFDMVWKELQEELEETVVPYFRLRIVLHKDIICFTIAL